MPYAELDALKEECGVVAAYGVGDDLPGLLYMGLFALQHRGEESAGIAVSNGKQIELAKGPGLVSEVFTTACLQHLYSIEPWLGIGHVRYGTSSDIGLDNAQPLIVRYLQGSMALAINGSLANTTRLRRELEENGQIFQTTSDTEVILNLIARYRREGIVTAVQRALSRVHGAYSLVLQSDDTLIAVRDAFGFRPLAIGRLGSGYVIASESCAFDAMGAELIRDVMPGEIIVIDENGLRSERLLGPEVERHSCVFEYIYFARIDSIVDGLNVHMVRRSLGRILAQEQPADADIVIGVPDSGVPAAVGYALESGLPYEEGLVKNRYVGRTFISPGQSLRNLKVRLKLNPNRHVLEGKRVVVVEDSIVRGTTSRNLIRALRDAGAKEVHMRISSPPYIAPCYYGIDTPSINELMAAQYSIEEIRQMIGADSLAFLSLEGLLRAVPGGGNCLACLTGKYPLQVCQERN
ncbi:MAG TPA: amidophosphoribosyltransferase [Firmicutes bacterium]|nr:amidophosphoribosyltransferase [Bacillota bacterium]